MKRPTMLVKAVLHQAALDLDLSVERDVASLQRRCQHEGFSFLAITLPTLSDALERGLESGTFTCPSNFSRHGRLPRFLSGFFKRVFGLDGRLLPDVDPEVIYWIRQICRFFKKPKIGCSPARERKAIDHFVEVEGELRSMTPQIERKDNVLDTISRLIWAQVFPELDNLDLVCHHGPGVTADRRLANERYDIRYWHDRSELTYPSDLHCFPNYGFAAEGAGESTESGSGIRYLRVREELPVRVVFVPKTLTAPRVIAIEPSHVQYMQQSLKDHVYTVLEAHPLTKHSIRFSRQDVNQWLAYESSITKKLATLDLKDASDRVHLHLVQRIFKTSGILEYLEDARSLHATLPNGKNMVLFKYASMGSALCFPVEAMVFYTLIQSAMHQLDGRRPTSRSIRDYSRKIDIYGDDIIVPVEYADVVVRYLESYALKVNVNKSFQHSCFRESCGADYYNGTPVNPVYARTIPHDDLRHWGAEEVMSWNATADLFYMRGKWHVAQVIRDLLSRVVRRPIPRTRVLGPGVAHFSLLFTTNLRWNAELQCFKQKRLQYQPSLKKDDINGNALACLNKWGIAVHTNKREGGRMDLGPNPFARRLAEREELWALDQVSHHLRQCEQLHQVGEARPRYGGVSGVSFRSEDHEPIKASGIHCLEDAPASLAAAHVDRTMEQLASREREIANLLSESAFDNLFTGRSEGLCFTHSTKRGGFKSKRRWVSLIG